METLKTNILNLVSEEHETVYSFASQVLAGIESENQTPEGRTAHLMFNAIIRFADSRTDIDKDLMQLIRTAKSEQTRLQEGSRLDLGWINPSRFEQTVQESKKLEHEIMILAYLVGLTGEQKVELFNKIQDLTCYSNG
jgi:hypothetical protein